MCGIAGIFAYSDAAPPVNREELLRVRDAMLDRGPDGAGLWFTADQRLGLAHRRLAIIDLTNSGAQPMASDDGRMCVTFNGEIYNYRELRRELEGRGYRFRSNSDTEVLLHLYADRGEEMVHALRGMYAFAIWDAPAQSLFLARDPFGIKPLYYADDGSTLRFASQVKALVKGGAVDTAPEPAGSVGFLVWGCVPEPYTLYRGIVALAPGSYMRVVRDRRASVTAYFHIGAELRRAEEAPSSNAAEAREILRAALADSVKSHLVSDVPVGLFLSAGVDSSVLAGLAVEQAGSEVKAVTLGFPTYRGTPRDEVPVAEQVARKYRIHHDVHWIDREDFDTELDRILAVMDQPSTDGVNTYFVSRAASRAGIKVAFSGLGGDELFGGYPSFTQVPRLVRRLSFSRCLPGIGPLTRLLCAPFLPLLASPKYASLFEYGGTYAGAYLLRRALFLPWEVTSILDPVTVATGLEKLQITEQLELLTGGLREPRTRIAALEIGWYMRNQLLRDADWAGMAHSLEIRVPLVDVHLFRALAPLVAAHGPTKRDFAGVLTSPLPDQVLSRPKTGFVTPVSEWISSISEIGHGTRGLRGWARRVLPPQPKMFRALALVTDAFGGSGGIAKFNRDLIYALAAMPECAEVVVAPRLITCELEPIPRNVRHITEASAGKIQYVCATAREAFRGRVDLVVSGHINLVTLSAALAFIKRSRSLLIIHGIDAWTRRAGLFASRCLSQFSLIAGVSNVTLSRFLSWARVDPAKLRLLPNCVDGAKYTPGPKPADLAEALGLNDRTVIMTLGRLSTEERYKGFDEVIEALPALAQQVPDISYLICGDGTDRDRLKAKAEALTVADRVVFTGFVPEDRKADYYRLADAYVMPSRGEGFGIVLLEALACGIPVLGSERDGTSEALLNGELGLLVDPSNPEDVHAGVLETLKRRPGEVPAALTHYSTAAFAKRAETIVREAVVLQQA